MKTKQGQAFKITQRHYDIIIKQGFDNHPEECGGFFGGKDNIIKALLPVYNHHLNNKTDTYMVYKEDVERAHLFFQKHNLDYFGLYHTHPNGSANPSKQDLSNKERYMLIVSYQHYQQPDFAIWEVINNFPYRCPVEILTKDYEVKDDASQNAPQVQQNCVIQNWNQLNSTLNNLVNNKGLAYTRYNSHHPNSDFNTLA